MATQRYHIVSGDESTIHDEPHIEGTRVTVRDVHVRVEKRGDEPEQVATQLDIALGDVYEALAYYHHNPDEMAAVEARHEDAVAEAKGGSTLSPDDN